MKRSEVRKVWRSVKLDVIDYVEGMTDKGMEEVIELMGKGWKKKAHDSSDNV